MEASTRRAKEAGKVRLLCQSALRAHWYWFRSTSAQAGGRLPWLFICFSELLEHTLSGHANFVDRPLAYGVGRMHVSRTFPRGLPGVQALPPTLAMGLMIICIIYFRSLGFSGSPRRIGPSLSRRSRDPYLCALHAAFCCRGKLRLCLSSWQ